MTVRPVLIDPERGTWALHDADTGHAIPEHGTFSRHADADSVARLVNDPDAWFRGLADGAYEREMERIAAEDEEAERTGVLNSG